MLKLGLKTSTKYKILIEQKFRLIVEKNAVKPDMTKIEIRLIQKLRKDISPKIVLTILGHILL